MSFPGKRILQRGKHQLFLAYKPYRFRVAGLTEPLVRASHKLLPPALTPEDWAGSHVLHDEAVPTLPTSPIPRKLYLFWTGGNPLTPNRQRAIDSIRRHNPTIDVTLVTADTLDDFLIPGVPLHPAYESLSFIHRADYLTAYAMHFHGGGTADLKQATSSWAPVFERMDASTDAWLAGYRVPVRLMTPNMPDPRQEKVMRRFSEQRLGQTAYIARPGTPLTAEWWRALNVHLDRRYDELLANPGNERGDNSAYPLHLNEILAQIIDPLEIKHRMHLLYDERLMMNHNDYI